MINLSPGTHDYEINAFNTCGSATEIISFTYNNLPNNGANNTIEKDLNEEKVKDYTSKSTDHENESRKMKRKCFWN